ncbi:MAG: hypothetical protein KGL39_41065 [Patescibacteria group bacterium]|nr:hypothetical protein [Patescibacteria group bacterium]
MDELVAYIAGIRLTARALPWERVKSNVVHSYNAAGFTSPSQNIVCAASPYAGLLTAAMLLNTGHVSVRDKLLTTCLVRNPMMRIRALSAEDTVDDRMLSILGKSAPVIDAVALICQYELPKCRAADYATRGVSLDAWSWLRYLALSDAPITSRDLETLDLQIRLHDVIWWAFKDIAVVASEPHTILTAPTSSTSSIRVLHAVDQPAIQYSDGWGVWMWNGKLANKQIVLTPETITAAQIGDEKLRCFHGAMAARRCVGAD